MIGRYLVIFLISLLVIVGTVSATVVRYEYTSQDIWTCPSNVYSINATLIGGGAGGSGGGLIYNASGRAQIVGSGGESGETTTITIPVTPGTQYTISPGDPGRGTNGWYKGTLTASTVYNGTSGGQTCAFGYCVDGGVGWHTNVSTFYGTTTITRNGNEFGADGIDSNYFAYNGESTSWGSGAKAGLGKGAGGGGGAVGGPATYSTQNYPGGYGGDGSPGYVRIEYDSDQTPAVFIDGYVFDSETGAGIDNAVVTVSQYGAYSTDTTNESGYYQFSTPISIGGLTTMSFVDTGECPEDLCIPEYSEQTYLPYSNSFVPFYGGKVRINQTLTFSAVSGAENISAGITVRSGVFHQPTTYANMSLYDPVNETFYNITSNRYGFGVFKNLIPSYNYTAYVSTPNGTATPFTVTTNDGV